MNVNDSVNIWSNATLRDLAVINYGKSPKDILSASGVYPVVGTGGTERYGNKFLYDGDSIVLGRKGTIDRVHFATGRFWTIDTAYYLSDFNNSVPLWLFYYLQNINLRQLNEATGVPSLSRDRLYQIRIKKPPEHEQSKIAEILSTVDRAIAQTETLIAKQQRIKTGLMQDLLTCGIDEQGNLRSEETHEFKNSLLGRIPKDWEVKRISECCEYIVDCPHSTPEYILSGVPCIRTADMMPGYLLLSSALCVSKETYVKRIERLEPQKGDIIYSREGERLGIASPVGQERLCLGQRVMLLRPSPDNDSNYLLNIMNAPIFYSRVTRGLGATTSPHINVGDIKESYVRSPRKDEQKLIGISLSNAQKAINTNRRTVAKLNRLKSSLMQDLLTGKKRVTPLLN